MILVPVLNFSPLPKMGDVVHLVSIARPYLGVVTYIYTGVDRGYRVRFTDLTGKHHYGYHGGYELIIVYKVGEIL